MTLAIILLFISILLIAIIKGNPRDTDEYFSNFKKTGTFTITTSLLASLIGGWMFFGLTQIGYEAGVAGIAIGLGYTIGLAFFAYKSNAIYSISTETHSHNLIDVIKSVYGGRVYVLVVILNVLFFLGVLAAQFVALKTLLGTLSVDNSNLIFWAISASVVIYSAVGGFKGVLITDKYQIFGIAILIFLIIYMFLPQVSVISTLPVEKINGTGYGIAFLIASIAIFPLTIFCRADLWQRASSASTSGAFKSSILLTIPILLFVYTTFTVFGMVAGANGELPINFLVDKLSSLLGSEFGIGVFIFGVGCALISTIDTSTNVLSRIISGIVVRGDEHSGILVPRIISFLVGITALMLALLMSDIVDIIISAGAIILVMFPTVLSLLRVGIISNSRDYETAAFWSILIGLSSLIVVAIFIDIKAAFIAGFIASYLGWFGARAARKLSTNT